MSTPAIIATLNQMLDIEQQSLALRVHESNPYVSLSEVAVNNAVRSMALHARSHREALSEMILDLGGQPVPRRANIETANLHYLDLFAVVPLLLESHEKVVAQYKQLTPRLAGHKPAADLAARILARHESDLETLRGLIPVASGTSTT